MNLAESLLTQRKLITGECFCTEGKCQKESSHAYVEV